MKDPAITSLRHIFYRWEQQVALLYSFVDVMIFQQIKYDPSTYGMSNKM